MKALRVVLLVHGLITLAGFFVLTAIPTVIPSMVGITLQPSEYLLVYLVAAAELAVAVLSFGAMRITDWAAMQLILATFVALHLVSGVLDLVYLQQIGVNRTMIVNAVLRFTVVAIFLTAWRVSRPHQTPGTSR